MNVLLVRHGETAWNAEGRYQGRTDIPLSETGRGQALALGERLSDVTIHRAVCSPLVRARETAELALGNRRNILTTDPDLQEISHGQWEGRITPDIQTADPDLYQRWKTQPGPDTPAGPGAETLGQVRDRAMRALAWALDGLTSNQTVLIVAHDAVNRTIICDVIGLPLTRVWTFQQSPATINALTGASPATMQLVRLNDASHHAGIFAAANHRAL